MEAMRQAQGRFERLEAAASSLLSIWQIKA
jgi:hypothetical protein